MEGRYWKTVEAIKSSSALPEDGIEKSRKILEMCSRGYTFDLFLLMEAIKISVPDRQLVVSFKIRSHMHLEKK